MSMKLAIFILGTAVALPSFGYAQGTVPGAERGAREGGDAAGPVGAVVGGAVGAATGTVGGVLGARPDCRSETVHRENGEGDFETVHRTNCPSDRRFAFAGLVQQVRSGAGQSRQLRDAVVWGEGGGRGGREKGGDSMRIRG